MRFKREKPEPKKPEPVWPQPAKPVEAPKVEQPKEVNLKRCCVSCSFYSDHKCKRFPPTIKATGDSDYPDVCISGWCGEYKGK